MMKTMNHLNQLNSLKEIKDLVMKLPFDMRIQFRREIVNHRKANRDVNFETSV